MKYYSFDAEAIKATNKVFPPDIEADANIVFHGTSCAYCNRIESMGFEHGYRPWSQNDLRSIARAISDTNPALSTDIEKWADHPVRLSFATSSHVACQYAIAGRGGQTLGFVREYHGQSGIIPKDIENVLSAVDATDSCVYAVSIRDIPSESRSREGPMWYICTSVNVEAIVAKIIVPRGTLLSAIKQPSISDVYQPMWQEQLRQQSSP